MHGLLCCLCSRFATERGHTAHCISCCILAHGLLLNGRFTNLVLPCRVIVSLLDCRVVGVSLKHWADLQTAVVWLWVRLARDGKTVHMPELLEVFSAVICT
jgi:hypothetical protein